MVLNKTYSEFHTRSTYKRLKTPKIKTMKTVYGKIVEQETFYGKLFCFREKLLINLVEVTKPIYAKLMKRNREPWNLSAQKLQQYPACSLGKDLGLFLEREGFDLLPLYEDHDVMHVLLQYKTTVIEEAYMQFYLIGNGKRSLYAFGTALLALFAFPEFYKVFKQEYKKGKKALPFWSWDFRHLLKEPTQNLRNMIYKVYYDQEIISF